MDEGVRVRRWDIANESTGEMMVMIGIATGAGDAIAMSLEEARQLQQRPAEALAHVDAGTTPE